MIASYSALDRVGVQLAPAWLYVGILWPVCAIGLGVVWLVRPRLAGGAYAATELRIDYRQAVTGGVLTLTSYGLVLFALARAPLAIIAPLRESAVVLTSTWGVLRLREATGRREVGVRLTGALLVLAGAVVLAVAR
jgi:uncharacterized membrane protein